MDSLLDQIRPLAKDHALDHRARLSVRGDIERIKDALGTERWPPGTVAIFSCSGRDLYEEIPLPCRVREQVMADATPLVRPMLAVVGEYCRACVLVVDWKSARSGRCTRTRCARVSTVTDPLRRAGNTGSRTEDRVQNRVVRDGTTVPGVVCDQSRWLAASGDLCPVCSGPTRHTPDVLDELAAAVIETGGSARQIVADLMPEEYLVAAKLRFPPPPPEPEQPA